MFVFACTILNAYIIRTVYLNTQKSHIFCSTSANKPSTSCVRNNLVDIITLVARVATDTVMI